MGREDDQRNDGYSRARERKKYKDEILSLKLHCNVYKAPRETGKVKFLFLNDGCGHHVRFIEREDPIALSLVFSLSFWRAAVVAAPPPPPSSSIRLRLWVV